MGLFGPNKAQRERQKQVERNNNLREAERKLAGGGWWTCQVCGTTNANNNQQCKNCRNRRPY